MNKNPLSRSQPQAAASTLQLGSKHSADCGDSVASTPVNPLATPSEALGQPAEGAAAQSSGEQASRAAGQPVHAASRSLAAADTLQPAAGLNSDSMPTSRAAAPSAAHTLPEACTPLLGADATPDSWAADRAVGAEAASAVDFAFTPTDFSSARERAEKSAAQPHAEQPQGSLLEMHAERATGQGAAQGEEPQDEQRPAAAAAGRRSTQARAGASRPGSAGSLLPPVHPSYRASPLRTPASLLSGGDLPGPAAAGASGAGRGSTEQPQHGMSASRQLPPRPGSRAGAQHARRPSSASSLAGSNGIGRYVAAAGPPLQELPAGGQAPGSLSPFSPDMGALLAGLPTPAGAGQLPSGEDAAQQPPSASSWRLGRAASTGDAQCIFQNMLHQVSRSLRECPAVAQVPVRPPRPRSWAA
jgi:hypothetical protein